MSKIPAYRKVYAALKRDLKEGKYKKGDLLPTETELEQVFSVSRTTVRRAIALLADEGHLLVRQGKGTEVLEAATTQRLNRITSITETLRQKGINVTTQGMLIERVPAQGLVAEHLHLSDGESVFKVQRVQLADGMPLAIMVNYLKMNLAPDLDRYENTFTSLYGFLEEHYNVVFKNAVQFLSAVSATFTESQILRIPMGAPLLCSRRITYTEQGPVEYNIIKLVADKYEYCVYLEGRK